MVSHLLSDYHFIGGLLLQSSVVFTVEITLKGGDMIEMDGKRQIHDTQERFIFVFRDPGHWSSSMEFGNSRHDNHEIHNSSSQNQQVQQLSKSSFNGGATQQRRCRGNGLQPTVCLVQHSWKSHDVHTIFGIL